MRRFAWVALVVALCSATAIPRANAHALLRSSDPADGALLDVSPRRVVMDFTETPDLALSSFHVLDASGRRVEKPPPVRGGSGNEIVLNVGTLPNGVYTSTWRTVSRVDGHVTAGSFSFGVGVKEIPAGAAPSVAATPKPTVAAVAGRWLLYWGLALLLGTAVVALAAIDGMITGRAWFMAAGSAAAIAGWLVGVLDESAAAGSGLSRLLASSRGHVLDAEGITIVVAVIAAVSVARRATRTTFAVLGVAAASAMLVHAAAGHAGASASWKAYDIAVQWLHLIATGIWAGGLVVLFAGLRRAADRGRAAARFSALATAAIAVVALTGGLRALSEVGSLSRLFSTSYGVTVVVKVGLFAALLVLGGLNRLRNVPRLVAGTADEKPLRTSVGAEIAVIAGVLVATGILTGLTPSSTLASAKPRAPQSVVVIASDFAQSVRARLEVTPGTVGPNRFAVELRDFDTKQPVAATKVALRFAIPGRPEVAASTLELAKTSEAVWSARGTQLALDSRYAVTIVVQEATTSVEIHLALEPRAATQNISCVPGGTGQPTLCTIDLGEKRSVQAYVDPARAGKSEVHFTFFDATGSELPVGSATIEARSPDGGDAAVKTTRFSAGHFVGELTVTPGTWRFRVRATARDGSVFSASFDQAIGS